MRKKRLKLEVVVDEALKLLPRGMDIPSFTEWVNEKGMTFKEVQEKINN